MACFDQTTKGAIKLSDCLLLKPGQTVASTYNEPADLVNILVSNLFVLAGIVLFIMVIVAGLKFALQGAKGKDDAKGMLQAVVVGFLVMFSAYWIVRIIEILIGTKILL